MDSETEGTGQPGDNGQMRPGYIKLEHPILPTSSTLRFKGVNLPTGPMVAVISGHAAGMQVLFFPPDVALRMAARLREEALAAPTLAVASSPIIVPGR